MGQKLSIFHEGGIKTKGQLTRNDDVSQISLVRDVIDTEPSDVKDWKFSRQLQLNILVHVLSNWLQVSKLVGNLNKKQV